MKFCTAHLNSFGEILLKGYPIKQHFTGERNCWSTGTINEQNLLKRMKYSRALSVWGHHIHCLFVMQKIVNVGVSKHNYNVKLTYHQKKNIKFVSKLSFTTLVHIWKFLNELLQEIIQLYWNVFFVNIQMCSTDIRNINIESH